MDIAVDSAQHGSGMTGFGAHLVQFHEHDDELVSGVADFLGSGLAAAEGCVAATTPAHQVGIVRALRAAGLDPAPVVFLDAAASLARIVVEGDVAIDRGRFRELVDGALRAAVAKAAVPRVRVFGEMVALLWDRGQVPLAMELEAEWNRAARESLPFTLLCGYRMPPVTDDAAAADRFFDACGHHSAVRRGPDSPTEAWRRFDDATRDLPGARAFVRGTLGGWGCHAVATEAALVVTELATNAVIHARTPFHVSVARSPDDERAVRVAVHDASEAEPALRLFSSGSSTGRGLHLVRALSAAWGVDRFAGRKTVWAEVRATR
jgi:hypothetical protein